MACLGRYVSLGIQYWVDMVFFIVSSFLGCSGRLLSKSKMSLAFLEATGNSNLGSSRVDINRANR